ncbi:MAG: flagellar basal-body MS-ring/collar protein FliF [Pseudomonadota bacterium]
MVNDVNTVTSKLSMAWNAAEPRRKAMLVLGLAAMIAALALFARIVATPTMALLYSGLDSSAASGVIEGLDRQAVQYEVRGDAIYVPADVRDRVRITLAGEGLPAAGAAGYELLDGLSGFGTTAEMFDAAYWRAKEGELARTVLASPRVIRARVHIAQTTRRPFEANAPVTASVTVSTSSGALSRNQAEAIRFLVASAVSGLSLHNVAVIDQENGVILRSGETETKAGAAEEAATQTEALRRNVMRLLEARVGAGAAIVEVAVDAARDSETIRERRLDPESRIVIHTDTEESTDAAEGEATGVTVASNLADGDVEGGDQSSRQASRTRERINYEISETVSERIRPAGEIRKISVAVMVDGIRTDDGTGTMIWEPRPEEELNALGDLVKSAVGYDEARGDVVTIQSLQFSDVGGQGSVATSSVMDILGDNAMSIIQLLTLGMVALMLGLFVVRPILSVAGPAGGQDFAMPTEIGDGGFAGSTGGTGGEMGGGFFSDMPAGQGFDIPSGDMIDAQALDVDQRALLETTVAEKPDEATKLLSSWLDEPADKEQAA